MTKIYESPDRGNTVYEREFGDTDRKLVKRSLHDQLREDQMWGEIRRMARTNPIMQEELERVIILYQLLKEEHGG